MESTVGNDDQQNGVRARKKDLVIRGEGALVCFLCEKSFGSMKRLFYHTSGGYHSDNARKTYFELNPNTIKAGGGHHKNFDAYKEVDISTEDLFGWKVSTGKRGRPGLKVAKDGVEIDDKEKEAAEGLLLLARGHPAPSFKEVEIKDLMAEPTIEQRLIPGDQDKGGCMVGGHGHESMAEPSAVVPQTVKAGYMVVHDMMSMKTLFPPPWKKLKIRHFI